MRMRQASVSTELKYELHVRSVWICLTNFYLIQILGTRNNAKFGVHMYQSQ